MYFKEFYYNLGLSSGDLQSLWEFSDSRGDNNVRCYNNQYSGVLTGQTPASFYNTSGVGAFNGNSYVEVTDYSDISSSQYSVVLDFERKRSSGEVLFSNYQTGLLGASGVTVGLTDNNKVFLHSEFSGQSMYHVFQDTILSKRNILNLNISPFATTVRQLDIVSKDVFQEDYPYQFTHSIQSNSFRLGGNPIFEQNYGIGGFSGDMSLFSLHSNPLDKDVSKYLTRGFANYSTFNPSVYEVTRRDDIHYTSSLTSGFSDSGVFSSLNTGVSNYFFNSAGNNRTYTGLITATISSGGSISFTGDFSDLEGTPLGAYGLSNISSSLSAGSFPIEFYYNNNGIENVLFTYKASIQNSAIQPEPFKYHQNINEVWANNNTLPSVEVSNYESLKLSGVFITEGVTGSPEVYTVNTNTGIAPTGMNRLATYSTSRNRFFIPNIPNYPTGNLSFFIRGSGLSSSSGISISSDRYVFFDAIPSFVAADFVNYDVSSGYFSLFSGSGSLTVPAGSGFYRNSSRVMTNNGNLFKRINQEYLETHDYDLLHGKTLNPSTSYSPVLSLSETGYWNV